MRYKLLKRLREEARKRVFIEEPEPYSWYIAINTGMKLEDNKPMKVHIVNDAPKDYINKTLAELRVNFVRHQLEKMKHEKEVL